MNSDFSNDGLPALRPASQTFSFVIDKDGEMPEGAVPLQSQLNSHSSSPAGTPSPVPATVHGLSSFPEYEVPEYSSVEPIKVARQKKTKPGKKKRTVTVTATAT
jgi:AP-3 complex subunit delta-1